MLRNKQQNKQLHALIGELKIDAETKEELVHQFTNKRETQSSKMLVNECQALINHLKVMRGSKPKSASTGSATETTPENKMRRKILSICREMGGDWHNGLQYNWIKINAWLDKYGYLHKPLNDYKEKELPKLITQFEALLANKYAKR